ncbi:carbon-phosphorus lyase complex subunit PhnI [Granulicoccus phenolivorans]|uniref:carbon-phosphorus lyase complex subunit PhnI n=1 Tax=Granulicoccus phenolivorans TaxID=266854 RepID=UPI0004044040|nr:carbon-phosphorus lyase complex subunit PhnI [Granulicoccus phenolivorans]
MSYAGTSKGGTSAILAAEDLIRVERAEAGLDSVDTGQVRALFGASIDRLMGEAGLYDEDTAAAALLQAGGDLPEATHLLRAHRSTLPRLAVSEPIDPDQVQLLRRVVPATREPEGPQLLGNTRDYSARLLRRPGAPDPLPVSDQLRHAQQEQPVALPHPDEPVRRFSAWMRAQDRMVDRVDPTDPEPFDPAYQPVVLPVSRSALLSAMAVAETGGLINMWYRSILGPDGYADEDVTLGDVRHVRAEVRVTHPHTGEPVAIARIRFTDCEAISHLDERGEDPARFDVGYGIALGHNERKTIAMATLDLAAQRYGNGEEGLKLQQLLMMTTDPLASNGFLEHLKLPHYVTFRSQLDRAEAARQEQREHGGGTGLLIGTTGPADIESADTPAGTDREGLPV